MPRVVRKRYPWSGPLDKITEDCTESGDVLIQRLRDTRRTGAPFFYTPVSTGSEVAIEPSMLVTVQT